MAGPNFVEERIRRHDEHTVFCSSLVLASISDTAPIAGALPYVLDGNYFAGLCREEKEDESQKS